MKYRFKLWKYNSYSADEAEAMLNQMAQSGWRLKNVENIASFEPAYGKKPQYTIEVLPPGFFGADYDEEKEMKDFYEQLGWSFVKRIGTDGMYLFINESGAAVPCAYYSKEERTALQRSRMKWSFILGGFISFVLYSFLQWKGLLERDFGAGVYITIIMLVSLIAIGYMLPALAALAYKKMGRENLLTRVDAWIGIACGGILLLLSILTIPVNMYLYHSGQLFNHIHEVGFFTYILVLCTIGAPLMLPVGLYLQLLTDNKAVQIGGTVFLIFAAFGVVTMPALLETQLGIGI